MVARRQSTHQARTRYSLSGRETGTSDEDGEAVTRGMHDRVVDGAAMLIEALRSGGTIDGRLRGAIGGRLDTMLVVKRSGEEPSTCLLV